MPGSPGALNLQQMENEIFITVSVKDLSFPNVLQIMI